MVQQIELSSMTLEKHTARCVKLRIVLKCTTMVVVVSTQLELDRSLESVLRPLSTKPNKDINLDSGHVGPILLHSAGLVQT